MYTEYRIHYVIIGRNINQNYEHSRVLQVEVKEIWNAEQRYHIKHRIQNRRTTWNAAYRIERNNMAEDSSVEEQGLIDETKLIKSVQILIEVKELTLCEKVESNTIPGNP